MGKRDRRNILASLTLTDIIIVLNVTVVVIQMVHTVGIMQDALVVDMGDVLVPENTFGESNSESTLNLENFCVEALHIPAHYLHYWTRPFDYDAYLIHTTEGYSFAISGPQIHAWKHGGNNVG